MRRAVGLCVWLLALAVASGAGAQPVAQPSTVLDGPSASIGALSGVSIARDGAGGLVYLKGAAGAQHVFGSRLLAGSFVAPEQLDSGLPAGSSQPVLAAGENGLLLLAFVNGGGLYVVTRSSAAAPYSMPQLLAAGASNPAIAISIHDKGYLAFTVAGPAGHNVRAAYYYNGQWAVESAPLDAAPGNDAGVGSGAPQVAAAGDGVAIVVWGEGGHVYTRRVWATSPSVVFEQADIPSFAGAPEVSADSAVVATGDDSSYADVAFREQFSLASGPQPRVLMHRLRGSRYEDAVPADNLTPDMPDGATAPKIVETGSTHGLLTSSRSSSSAVISAQLGDGGLIQSVGRIDSLANSSASYPVPSTTGFFSGLVAWQHDPGAASMTEIRARYYDGTSFGPELVLSSPTLGPTDAGSGLVAAGDILGDLAVAWVQGTGAQRAIVTAQLYYPPGSFGPLKPTQYTASAAPTFTWSPSREQWGPVRYLLSIDGTQVGQTGATSLRAPRPLADGAHSWQVTAVNQAGVMTAARQTSVFVDTVAPSVQVSLTGRRRAGRRLRLGVRYTDALPPAPVIGASGVSRVLVTWGDGSSAVISRGAAHTYAVAGTYRLTVTVTDRAGNATRLAQRVRIVG